MSENKPYIIDLSRLPIGTHSFDIQLDNAFFESLEKSEILSGEVACKATLNLREEDYQLKISELSLLCAIGASTPCPLKSKTSKKSGLKRRKTKSSIVNRLIVN